MNAMNMPEPEEMIECADGASCVAFLYYLGDGATRMTISEVAHSHGYYVSFLALEDDPALANEDGEMPLVDRYYDGDENVFEEWNPTSPGEGWTLAGKWDTEEGPLSVWIKKKPLPEGVVVVNG